MNNKHNWGNVLEWHERLHADNNRGAKATLKRCKTLAEIYLQPEYVSLVQTLKKSPNQNLAIIAGVLAHVKEAKEAAAASDNIAKKMAMIKPQQNMPTISSIRFKQLLACKDGDKLLRMLIRIVPQIGDFDLKKFAENIYYWNKPKIKRQWAFDYYWQIDQQTSNTKGK